MFYLFTIDGPVVDTILYFYVYVKDGNKLTCTVLTKVEDQRYQIRLILVDSCCEEM